MEITVNLDSEDPSTVNLNDFPLGKFEKLLRKNLNKVSRDRKSADLRLEVPKYISDEYRDYYLKGLDGYLKCCCRFKLNVNALSADDVFALALVAREYGDVSPLLRLLKHVKVLDDKYYWLYLAEEPTLFFSAVEMEGYRRRIITSLDLFDLSRNNGLIQKELDLGHVFLINKNPSSLSPELDSQYLEQNPTSKWKEVPFTKEDNKLIEEILRLGFVIAGPVVDCCINRRYTYVKLPDLAIQQIVTACQISGNRNLDFKAFFVEYLGDSLSNEESKDLAIYLRALIEDIENRTGRLYLDEELIMPMVKDPTRDFDVLRAKFKDIVAVDDTGIKLRMLKLPITVDVYTTVGPEPVLEILDYLRRLAPEYVTEENLRELGQEIKIDPQVSCLAVRVRPSNLTFRFIKMRYASLSDIAASQDLDCNRAILRLRKGNLQFVAPQAYIDAVDYNICLLNPCNDSTSYFRELCESTFQGYSNYVTPGIMARMPKIVPLERKKLAKREYRFYPAEELRTVSHTRGAFDSVRAKYVTQSELIYSADTLIGNIFNDEVPKSSSDFEIVYPLYKQFAQSLWFDVEPDLPIQSIYVNHHRRKFLVTSINYLTYNHIEELLGTLKEFSKMGEIPNNLREEFDANEEAADIEKEGLLSLIKDKLPAVLAEVSLKLTESDILILSNMIAIAEERLVLIATAEERLEQLDEAYEELEPEERENLVRELTGLVLGPDVFDPEE
jgi:hypothetical protein